MRELSPKQSKAPEAGSVDIARSFRAAPTVKQSSDNAAQDTGRAGPPPFGHDFGRIAVHAKRPATIQTKLTISTPGDIYEQEADRVADEIMAMPEQRTYAATPAVSDRTLSPPIFRAQQKSVSEKGTEEEEDVPIKVPADKCCGEEDEHVQRKAAAPQNDAHLGPQLDPEVGTRIQTMRGGGRLLSPSERQFMEPRFGADFSAIRVHANQESDTQSRALNARAFTLGSDIFFRSGEYQAGKAAGYRLLAHELTHSIQQGAVNPLNIGANRTSVPFVQRQVPPPVVAPVVPPASVAAVNYLPIIAAAPTGTLWGITKFDDIVVDITAYANGANWSCVLTKADQQTRQGVRLLPGVVEVTAASVAAEANCATLKTMITSLNTVANQGAHSGFYMLAAVQAHETLHVTQYQADLNPAFTTFKTAVEALTVPFASHPNAGAAKTAIKALAGYTTAAAALHTADVAANNKTAAHSPVAPFNTAEHAVVDPMITTITARRTALTCAP